MSGVDPYETINVNPLKKFKKEKIVTQIASVRVQEQERPKFNFYRIGDTKQIPINCMLNGK